MAHSSILAWRIPWREESGGLQSGEESGVTKESDMTEQLNNNNPKYSFCSWKYIMSERKVSIF